jgi:purine-binding chemotaxis protein CheW
MMMTSTHPAAEDKNALHEYVTLTVGEQLFGVPIGRVRDVFVPERLTRVPLAPQEIAGVLNLRGRIVTGIDLRSRLGMHSNQTAPAPLALGIECKNESYGLLIDSVGDVMKLPARDWEANPVNLDRALAPLSAGIYRLPGRLLIILDIDRVLDAENCSTEPQADGPNDRKSAGTNLEWGV